MIKRLTKGISFLVAAASIVSMVPAVAADLKKADTSEGTIYTAKSMGFGNYVLSGEINGEDDAVYYLANGKYTKLTDAGTGDTIGDINKDKYLDFNDGDYYIDITTGEKVDDDVLDDINNDVAEALRKKIKNNNDGRLSKDNYDGKLIQPDQIKGNKKTDIWGATGKWREFTYDLATKYQFKNKTQATIYTDEEGNYVDADYNLGNVGVYLTTEAGVKIENTEDVYEVKVGSGTYDLKAQINNDAVRDEDNDYITRSAKLTIWKKLKTEPDSKYDNVTDQVYFGSKANHHKAASINNDDNSVTVMQRISKAQDSDDIDGIKYAKNANTYFITDSDGNQAHIFGLGDVSDIGNGVSIDWTGGDVALVTGSSDGIASHFYDASEKKYYAQDINFKSENGYYYTDIGDYDDVDADAWGIGGGNLYCLGDGYVQKWINKDNKFEKIYKVDGGLENFSVAFDGSVAAWNTDDKMYSLIFNKPSSNANIDSTKASTTSAAVTTGWTKAADGTWNYVKGDGTKATGWLKDGAAWYYLKADGVMATGWQNVGGTWYYLNASGAIQTGWINDNGTWYYCNASGAMLSNTTVDGYVLGANGAWVK